MNNPLLAPLAFFIIDMLIGIAIGYMGRDYIADALYWLRRHTPVMCEVCHKIVLRGDSYRAFHRVHGITTLCEDCWRTLYEPSKQERP